MVFKNPYEDDSSAMGYEFVTELSPGIWKTSRKTDRVEHLAHDLSNLLITDSADEEKNKTDLYRLMNSENLDLAEPLGIILNHQNLLSLKEFVTIQRPIIGQPQEQYFAVWDFCDAGTLANLLVRPNALPLNTKLYPGDDPNGPKPNRDVDESNMTLDPQFLDPEGEGEPMETDENVPGTKHLPESLCWHVLTSVMRALAWLHDGSRDIQWGSNTAPSRVKYDRNWEPMLHRNVIPENIFLMHPKRNETYGSCKLGNYSQLYITSHQPGDGKKIGERHRSKALAPPRGVEFQPLEELVQLDERYGYTYPQQPDQPYTVVSEIRALGEALQAMMLPPVYDGNNLAGVRHRSVEDNLRRTAYTNNLKNMVLLLMTGNPDETNEDGSYVFGDDREHFTTRICFEVHWAFLSWRESADPDAKMFVAEEELLVEQVKEDLEEQTVEQSAKQTTEDYLNELERRANLDMDPALISEMLALFSEDEDHEIPDLTPPPTPPGEYVENYDVELINVAELPEPDPSSFGRYSDSSDDDK